MVSKILIAVLALSALILSGAARATEDDKAKDKPPANRRNFIACPIVRDTKTVPCWLAEYEGELYYLGIQQDIGAEFYPPQLNHEVLVEGTVSEGPRICGGIPLKPVKISVMREINRACNTLLPAEDGIEAPVSPRGAGPSSRHSRPLASPPPQPKLGPPFETREFQILFDFDSDFLPSRSTRVVSEAVRYAKASKATRIEVSGYRGTTLLSNGQKLVESQQIAEVRAKKVGGFFPGLGIPSSIVTVNWKSEAETADGVTDPARRRVVIAVKP
jgi:outer membrane protein OmpA-like peptidoglycan-associated protein